MVAAANSSNEMLSPLKVMVSDIRGQYSEPLRVLLEPHGFVIQRVRSGADAIWLAERRAVDAAVLDNDLPDMPGVRVLRAIRALGELMPIILVGVPSRPATPSEQEHLLRAALDFRAFSVLSAPVDLEVLLGQMARLFDQFLAAMHDEQASGIRDEACGEEPGRPKGQSQPPGPVEPTRAVPAPPGEGGPGGPVVQRWILRFRRRR